MLIPLASALRIYGVCLLALGHFSEALAQLQESASHFRALADTPMYPAMEELEVELKLGMCLTALGRPPEAAEHFRAGLDVLRALAVSESGLQPALAPYLAQMSDQLLDFRQSPVLTASAALLTQILDRSAEILGHLGWHDTAEQIT